MTESHKPFRLIVNRNTKEVFYSIDNKPFETDSSPNSYEQASQLTMVLRSVNDPAEVLKQLAEIHKNKDRE